MNAMFHEKQLSLESLPLKFYWTITIGSNGAPTITRARGLKSITRTSAGLYVLTLGQPCPVFLGFNASILLASGLPAVDNVFIAAQTIATATPTITIQCSGPTSSSVTTPVAVDPDSGSVLYIELTVNNSTSI